MLQYLLSRYINLNIKNKNYKNSEYKFRNRDISMNQRLYKNIFLSLLFVSNYAVFADADYQLFCPNGGAQTYAELNQKNPFVMSVGTSMSQTDPSIQNTMHPDFIRKKMYQKAQGKDGAEWLKHEKRFWYVLRALDSWMCGNGHVINPGSLDEKKDQKTIQAILADCAKPNDAKQLSLSKCPYCADPSVVYLGDDTKFTLAHENAMVEQIRALYVNRQSKKLPNMRLSIEIGSILKTNSIEIDEQKLNDLVAFITKLGNPLLFFHHYANPISIPYLFEKEEHIEWFANICAAIMQQLPQITHVCPVSQPLGFVNRIMRDGGLPPFEYKITQNQLLDNITKAQVAAALAMKKVNPALQVLVSHQWKPMRPKHTSTLDPRMLFELGICKIADSMYNGKFVSLIKDHIAIFDGIALSVYPALEFDLWAPVGSNIAGRMDFEGSLEAIVATSQAFPGMPIYIVETGCNTTDPVIKRGFIDMMLCVCKRAVDLGIPVKGLYFWAITNDSRFYREWNAPAGSCNFGPFDALDPVNPTASINAAGKHIKDILSQLPV